VRVQTKFIKGATQEDLENRVNYFLNRTKGNLIEIRPVAYSTMSMPYSDGIQDGWDYKTEFAVIISYRPKRKPLNVLILKVKSLKNKK